MAVYGLISAERSDGNESEISFFRTWTGSNGALHELTMGSPRVNQVIALGTWGCPEVLWVPLGRCPGVALGVALRCVSSAENFSIERLEEAGRAVALRSTRPETP